MATIPIASQITTSTDENNRTDSDTNLSAEILKMNYMRYQYLDPC